MIGTVIVLESFLFLITMIDIAASLYLSLKTFRLNLSIQI
jgi:hypothetical protein